TNKDTKIFTKANISNKLQLEYLKKELKKEEKINSKYSILIECSSKTCYEKQQKHDREGEEISFEYMEKICLLYKQYAYKLYSKYIIFNTEQIKLENYYKEFNEDSIVAFLYIVTKVETTLHPFSKKIYTIQKKKNNSELYTIEEKLEKEEENSITSYTNRNILVDSISKIQNIFFIYKVVDTSDYKNYLLCLYSVCSNSQKITINIVIEDIFFNIKLKDKNLIDSYIDEFNPESYDMITKQSFNSTEKH
ncbi:44443_t:CDS:2, partial [Gigaspora margarita]